MILDIIVAFFASITLTNAVWYYCKWKSARDYNTILLMERIDALEMKRKTIDKACVVFCKRCVHNQVLKRCMYLGKDCILLDAFRKDLEE